MNEIEIKRAQYPRVSDIIFKQNRDELNRINADILANAALRGTKVHLYAAAYARGFMIPAIEPEYFPYVDAFMQWYDENVDELLHYNMRLYDDFLCYSGEFDMILKLKNGKIVLLDLKTSATPSITWPLQLAAYANLCEKNGLDFDEVAVLHLKKKKKKKKESEDPSFPVVAAMMMYDYINEYWEIFSSALKCFHYFSSKEVKHGT